MNNQPSSAPQPGRIRFERKVARGVRGLWYVMQRIEGARHWVPLAGAKISRSEAQAYLRRSFSPGAKTFLTAHQAGE